MIFTSTMLSSTFEIVQFNNSEAPCPHNDSLCYLNFLYIQEASPITDKTSFSLNMQYTNKRTKFKITAAVMKETPQVGVGLIKNIFTNVKFCFSILQTSHQLNEINFCYKLNHIALIYFKNLKYSQIEPQNPI